MTRRYNVAGQLVQQVEKENGGNLLRQVDYSYDAVGNIVKEPTLPKPESVSVPSMTMTYSAANRLATYNGQAVSFDADGNLVSGPLSGEMANFSFDSRNRWISAGETNYRYDAENQRIGVNQTSYIINSQPALSQVLVKEENGIKTFYVYGLGLLGEENDGEYRSYHFDFRGSTVALTDKTGQMVQRFQYGPYGELVKGDAAVTPFLFNGKYGVMTDDNGLYYMRARYYSSVVKRFVNQDVLLGTPFKGQTLNRYAFVTGRPVSLVDPFGLTGTGIDEPVFWENFIPIWGPGKAAVFYFQNGQWVWGTINTGLAITDVFLVKAILTAVTKGICKGATKAGAGGDWPVISEVIDSKVVKQANSNMCGPACGEMVLKDRGLNILQQALGDGLTTDSSLARILSKMSGRIWEGGYVGKEVFDSLNQTGSWVAMMWRPMSKVGHWVVVDGIDDFGRVIIRDPAEGTLYQMTQKDFFQYWTEIAVFQR